MNCDRSLQETGTVTGVCRKGDLWLEFVGGGKCGKSLHEGGTVARVCRYEELWQEFACSCM